MIMKTYKNIIPLLTGVFILLIQSCDPNQDLFEKLDNDRQPHHETIDYSLIESDYTRFRGFISQYQAFNDTLPAMDFVPDILKVRFVTLRQNSRAMVSYNHFLMHPDWWDAGFGYELTFDDYALIGISNAFTPNNLARNNIPFFLLLTSPGAQEGDNKRIIYNFLENNEMRKNLDVYEFTGSSWAWIETIEDIPYVGYDLTEDDYQEFGGSIAQQNSFSEGYPPELYLPGLLRLRFALAIAGAEQVVRYNYYDGSQTVARIDKYEFDAVQWHKVSYTEERAEQYVFVEQGWAFDPTIDIQLNRSDYLFLAENDPIPHETFPDFGYYFGSSAFHSNFDIRLIGRRLNTDDDDNYRDPELGIIYENEGPEAAMDEMIRRIVEEGIPMLLQHKYPDAAPQVGGIDVHFFIHFQTFADNWVRRFPRAEYICTAAGNPPQFELVELIPDTE